MLGVGLVVVGLWLSLRLKHGDKRSMELKDYLSLIWVCCVCAVLCNAFGMAEGAKSVSWLGVKSIELRFKYGRYGLQTMYA